MAKTALVEKNFKDGEVVLRALDGAGLDITAALWFYDTESRDWRLILASPMVAQTSSIEGYTRIQSVIRPLPNISIGLDDISIVPPSHPLVETLRTALATGPGISGIRFSRNVVNGVYVEDAYIYRLQ